MATDPCDDSCLPQLDQVQLGEIYDLFNTRIRADLQDDYDCKKINGATYADTWAKLIGPLMGSCLGAMVDIKVKETPDDRALKQAQVLKVDAETGEIPLESTRRDCVTTADCSVKNAQATEIPLKSTREECLATAECDLKQAQEDKAIAEAGEIPLKSTREEELKEANVALKADQSTLYLRQAKGFDDNARQKLLDMQTNAWAMVFADTSLSTVTPTLQDTHICESFNRVKAGLDNNASPSNCANIPAC